MTVRFAFLFGNGNPGTFSDINEKGFILYLVEFFERRFNDDFFKNHLAEQIVLFVFYYHIKLNRYAFIYEISKIKANNAIPGKFAAMLKNRGEYLLHNLFCIVIIALYFFVVVLKVNT